MAAEVAKRDTNRIPVIMGVNPDGDVMMVRVSATGELLTDASSGGGEAVSIADGADVAEGATTDAAIITNATGSVSGKLRGIVALLASLRIAEDAAHVSGDFGIMGLGVSNVAQTTFGTDGDYAPHATDVKGNALTVGNIAHDGVDAGNPVKVGALAVAAEPTAVAALDRANLITDLVGKLIVLPYANPENFVSGCISSAMTGTTSTSLVAAPGAGLRNYITTIICSNSHATVGTDIIIQDGSGGTTLLVIPAAAVYGGAAIPLPTPLRQPTANTALFCANVTTGSSTKVSAVGYKGA